jgi:hypothetical protein
LAPFQQLQQPVLEQTSEVRTQGIPTMVAFGLVTVF